MRSRSTEILKCWKCWDAELLEVCTNVESNKKSKRLQRLKLSTFQYPGHQNVNSTFQPFCYYESLAARWTVLKVLMLKYWTFQHLHNIEMLKCWKYLNVEILKAQNVDTFNDIKSNKSFLYYINQKQSKQPWNNQNAIKAIKPAREQPSSRAIAPTSLFMSGCRHVASQNGKGPRTAKIEKSISVAIAVANLSHVGCTHVVLQSGKVPRAAKFKNAISVSIVVARYVTSDAHTWCCKAVEYPAWSNSTIQSWPRSSS